MHKEHRSVLYRYKTRKHQKTTIWLLAALINKSREQLQYLSAQVSGNFRFVFLRQPKLNVTKFDIQGDRDVFDEVLNSADVKEELVQLRLRLYGVHIDDWHSASSNHQAGIALLPYQLMEQTVHQWIKSFLFGDFQVLKKY